MNASIEAQPSPVEAEELRVRCLALVKIRDMTADEAAKFMLEDKLAIRPRFSELRKTGKIFDSGLRRLNESGKSATVWTTTKTLLTQ